MRYKLILFIATGIIIYSTSVMSADTAKTPVPMKEFHSIAFQSDLTCTKCHSETLPTERPDSTKCIECHGEMKEIAKLTSKHDRNPHDSNHYKYNIECASCHFEHKPSKALCNDCHKQYKYPNLK